MDRRPRDIYMPDAVPPDRWRGENRCVVGPFTDPAVTEYFATYVVDMSGYPSTAGEAFPKGDGWYLTIDKRNAHPRKPAPRQEPMQGRPQ